MIGCVCRNFNYLQEGVQLLLMEIHMKFFNEAVSVKEQLWWVIGTLSMICIAVKDEL